MIKPVGRDPLREFPEFAVLRDKFGMGLTSYTDALVHWVMVLEGESFKLAIARDRGDASFDIGLPGSRFWNIPEILHEMGLWGNLHEQVDDRKLAHVLQQNLPAVLRHIAEKEG